VFCLPAAKKTEAVIPLLEKRAAALLGTHFQSHMHYLSFREEGCEMYGLIGDPGITRYNRSGQYLFVNARPVHCLPLAFAIRDGYGTRVDTARHPIYVIHAQIEPSLIDVNVHPQKKEIRLREEEEMKQAMRTAVTKALQTKELPLDLEMEIPSFHLYETREVPPNFFENTYSSPLLVEEQIHFPLQEEMKAIGLFEHYLMISAQSAPRCLGLKEDKSGLVFIDLCAAEARILFEQLLSPQSKIGSQGLLLPLTFSCSKAEGEKLLSCSDELVELGLELRMIGPCVFMVEAIPSFLEEKEIHPLLQALAAAELEENPENRKKQCAQTICRLSRSGARTFSFDEGLKIVKQLKEAVEPLYCPRGKPIFYQMKKNEIEKHFQ
jgi:DNA mismatch repair protein MutL